MRSRNSSLGGTLAAIARAETWPPDARRTAVAIPFSDSILATRALVRDLGAGLFGGARDRGRYRAHAADGVAPYTGLAVDLTKTVMQQAIGGSRHRRWRERADDTVECERRLDEIVLEPLIEKFGNAFREQIRQGALGGDVFLEEPAPETGTAQEIVEPATGIGWGCEDEIADQLRGPFERRAIVGEAGAIVCRERVDGSLASGKIVRHDEARTVALGARSWQPGAR